MSAYPLTDATGSTAAWHRGQHQVLGPQGSHDWLQALMLASDIEGFAAGVAVVLVAVLVVVAAVGVVAYNVVAVAAVELVVLLWKNKHMLYSCSNCFT